MSYFDDRVIYDIEKDEILIGRPDIKVGKEPWTWFIYNGKNSFRPKGWKPCKRFVLIARENEGSLL